MKHAIIAAVAAIGLLGSAPAMADVKLVGSGASFPFPLYSSWFKDFSRKSDGVTVDYQSKGSGAGVQDLINNVVDFAASDSAMSDEQIAKVERGVVLLPMTAGEIVLAYNLPNVGELKLPRDVYPAIFLGQITNWNDQRIAAANPGVKLPDTPITVVVRSDSSGTTYAFTNHLAAVSEAFKNGPGTGNSVQWPSSNKIVRAPKNDGITATIKQTPGAIGYIEYGFAKLTKTPTASLQNKAGKFVSAESNSGAAALAAAADDFDQHMRAFVVDPGGEESYPIVTYTWMLFYKSGQSPEKVAAIKQMIEYGLTTGQASADQLGYIPLPKPVVEKVRSAAAQIGG